MADATLERLKRRLDSEEGSADLLPLGNDFYSNISSYTQKLKRSAASGASEISTRLTTTEEKMIDSLVRQLLKLRVKKAIQRNSVLQLLPEERYVCSAQQKFERRLDSLVVAVSGGRPSFVEFAHMSETKRSVTVRFLRGVDELVGLDLKHYGPFKAEDVASIPAASAEILIAGGDATQITSRDDT